MLHISSDPKKHEIRRACEHALMLQMTDLMLGATLRSCFNDIGACSVRPNIGDRLEKSSKKDIVAFPVRKMLEKRMRGKAFKKSAHHQTFAVSEVDFDKEGPNFSTVDLKFESPEQDLF